MYRDPSGTGPITGLAGIIAGGAAGAAGAALTGASWTGIIAGGVTGAVAGGTIGFFDPGPLWGTAAGAAGGGLADVSIQLSAGASLNWLELSGAILGGAGTGALAGQQERMRPV